MTTVSNLNLRCFELDLGLGFDNIDDIEFVLVGGWVELFKKQKSHNFIFCRGGYHC